MGIAVHWGIYRHPRKVVDASPGILLSAIGLDILALGALIVIKDSADPLIIGLIFGLEKFFLSHRRSANAVELPFALIGFLGLK